MVLKFFYLFYLHLGRDPCLRNAGLTRRVIFLESETMMLIFFDIVGDFYFSGASIIRYF